jgi:hypothetical protein
MVSFTFSPNEASEFTESMVIINDFRRLLRGPIFWIGFVLKVSGLKHCADVQLSEAIFWPFKGPFLSRKDRMLEQFIAQDHYELMKVLGATVDPSVFPQTGMTHFKFKDHGNGIFTPIRHDKIYHCDNEFMKEVSSICRFFAFVSFKDGETILGFRAPKMFGEFIWVSDNWELREYEDFRRPKQTPAEIRFEISSDFEDLKKFLA